MNDIVPWDTSEGAWWGDGGHLGVQAIGWRESTDVTKEDF